MGIAASLGCDSHLFRHSLRGEANEADAAKARIEQLDPAALDDVSGGTDPLGDSGDDWTTDGAIMPYPDPFEDLIGSRGSL